MYYIFSFPHLCLLSSAFHFSSFSYPLSSLIHLLPPSHFHALSLSPSSLILILSSLFYYSHPLPSSPSLNPFPSSSPCFSILNFHGKVHFVCCTWSLAMARYAAQTFQLCKLILPMLTMITFACYCFSRAALDEI